MADSSVPASSVLHSPTVSWATLWAHRGELSAAVWFVCSVLVYALSYAFAPGLYAFLSLRLLLPWYASLVFVLFVVLATSRWFARGVHFDGEPRRLPDNTITLVTGAASGIGFESAVEFARRGALVYVLIRGGGSGSRGIGVCADIAAAAAVPKERVRSVHCDLSSFESILQCARVLSDAVDHVDVLLNNAAVCGLATFSTAADGFEMHMGTNHFGHFLLTALLLPKLQRSVWRQGSRLVNVSSNSHMFLRGFDWKGIDSGLLPGNYHPATNYGMSKMANIYFTMEFEKRFGNMEKPTQESDAKGTIHSFAVQPGVVISELGRHLAPGATANKAYFSWLLRLFMKSAAEGCQTQLFCSISNNPVLVGGQYYQECTFAHRSAESRDEQKASEFWKWSEQETAKALQNLLNKPVAPSFHTFHALIQSQQSK